MSAKRGAVQGMVSSERRRRSDAAPTPSRLGARSVFLIALAVAGLVFFQRTHEADQRAAAAFPPNSGTIRLAGLPGPIEILRDDRGVPHIRAESESEGWFGLGFAHAQDRLAQMLWLRAKALGHTARTEGPEALGSDRLARLLEIGPASAAAFDALPPASQRVLEAYAEGVNARVTRVRQGREAPPAALRTAADEIENWAPSDGLAVVKLLSWCMGGTLETTLVLDELIQRLDSVPARPFFPSGSSVDFGVAGALPMDRADEGRAGPLDRFEPSQPTRQLCRPIGIPTGSAWVVDGAKSESGAPMVFGDWHLSPTVPALFYQAEVEAGAIDVAGATMPGSPIFWTGRNGSVAWVSVPSSAPVADLFIETMRRDQGRYQNGRRWTDLDTRTERLEVRTARGGAQTLRMPMLRTHHGPLIEALYGGLEPDASESDAGAAALANESSVQPASTPSSPGTGAVLESAAEVTQNTAAEKKAAKRAARRPGRALAWTGARAGDGLSSMLRLLRATSSSAVRSALEDHHEPVLAVAFADEQGGGGIQVAGWMAKRPLPTGIVPVQGRLRAFEWKQRVPALELPGAALGGKAEPDWLLAADQPWPSRAGLSQLEWLWRPGLRAAQIETGLSQLAEAGEEGRISLRAASEMLRGSASERAPRVASALVSLARNGPPLSRESEEVASLLARWDGSMAADSAGAAAYHLVIEELVEALLEPAFGERLFRHYLAAPHVRAQLAVEGLVLRAAQLRRAGGWTDEARVGEAARTSLRSTWIRLNNRLGPTRARWAWGSLHRLEFVPLVGPDSAEPWTTAFLGRARTPFGAGLASPGSEATLFVAGHRPGSNFRVDRTSVYRVAMDLGSADHFLSSLAPGQSEHPGHPHFEDGLAHHLTARLPLLSTHRLVLEEDGAEQLRLEPAP